MDGESHHRIAVVLGGCLALLATGVLAWLGYSAVAVRSEASTEEDDAPQDPDASEESDALTPGNLIAAAKKVASGGLVYHLERLSIGRTEDMQAAEYAKGRTAPGKIVTYAQTASESAHGHVVTQKVMDFFLWWNDYGPFPIVVLAGGAGADAHPVKEASAGFVRSIYLGDETDLAERTEADNRFAQYCDAAEAHGLVSGRSFTNIPGGDRPHVEDPDWRSYPAYVGG